MTDTDNPGLIVQRVPSNGNPGRTPESLFRAELALAFGLFQVLVVGFACVTELIWGTRALGFIYAAGLVLIVATLDWLRRGGDAGKVGSVLVGLVFGLLAITNLATGGHAIGANIALPTVALFSILMSSRRAGLIWVALILMQIGVVALLRRSDFPFPIQPNPRWVESAIDRVPLFFTLGSALIGWMVLRALELHRARLAAARADEASAKQRAALEAERFADFAQVAVDGFWETDAQLRLTYVSPGFAQAMGLSVSQMLGLTPEQAYLLRFPEAQGVPTFMTPLRQHEPFEDQRLIVAGEDGRRRWLLNQGQPLFDAAGQFAGYRGAVRDVTDQLRAERSLADTVRRLSLITDNMPAAITHIDAEQRFTFSNTTHAKWVGLARDQLVGKRVSDIHGPEILDQIAPHIERAFLGEKSTFELDSGDRQFRAIYVPEVGPSGAVTGVYGLIHDITKIKQIEAELRTLAEFDSLTGLSNRRRCLDRLNEAIARSERTGQWMAVMFLDLDHFKQINDTLGHEGGDLVLQEFARRISACTRRIDTVARIAGDEFVIILELLPSPADADTVARKIIDAVWPPFDIEGRKHSVSTSIGIAVRQPGETDAAALLRRADAALYAAKDRGRGGFHVAS